ncbi:MAG TPA: hypothetical protein PLW86_04915 [Rhodocyclaceae bacterium]|nr:hypothetical protein [Rhodocyclaceae bacterium]
MTFHCRASIAALSLFVVNAAIADSQTFAERVALAKRLEEQSATTEYFQKGMYPAIGSSLASAMRECMSRAGASAVKFTVVADISQDGKFTHIAHDPNTNTAACLAEAMASFRAPPPPMCDCGSALPIVIDMSVTP